MNFSQRLRRLRRYHPLAIMLKRYWIRQTAKKLQKKSELVKVIVGSGGFELDGWIETNLPAFDALDEHIWERLFEKTSLDRVLLEHVVEHWHEHQFRIFLRIVADYLTRVGFVRLAVPDGFHPDRNYIERARPGGIGRAAAEHKVLYDHAKMGNLLTDAGFEFRLVEYFDELGQFHQLPWDSDDGMIRRSAQFDTRNAEKPLTYTSLIVDCWPARKA